MSEVNQGILPLDASNPTLLPNTNLPVVQGLLTVSQSPAQLLAANPRVAATATATIGGSETDTDVLTLKLSNPVLPSGSVSVSVTASSDTLDTLAEKLAAALTSNTVLQGFGVFGTSLAGVVTVNHLGPVGNFSVLSASVSSGATETITLSPMSGDLSGGSGPVIPLSNFVSSQGHSTLWLRQGQPYDLNTDVVSSLVNGGANVM